LETYAGIIVITTNAPDRIDSAFGRRMDATIAFGKPRAAARRQIWLLHLPVGHEVGPDDLAAVAERYRLTGGQIRNAAMHARLLSTRERRPLDADVVRAAVAAEYRKAGAMQARRAEEGSAQARPGRVSVEDYLSVIAAAGAGRRARRGRRRARS
jgi:SpoVK/Ycf46/Vps4 family AAA+-type ATPase